MNCSKCNSQRVLELTAKCSDCCGYSLGDLEGDGYVPSGLGVGGGDYVEINLCLDCGQVQGQFPRPISEIEKDISDEQVIEFFENNFDAGKAISFHARRVNDLISYAEDYCSRFGKWMKEFLMENNPPEYSRIPTGSHDRGLGEPMPSAKEFLQMYRDNNSYLVR